MSSTNTNVVIAFELVLIICLAGYVFYKFAECGCYEKDKGNKSNVQTQSKVPRIDPREYSQITDWTTYSNVPPRDPIAYGKQDLRVYKDDEYLPKDIETFKGKPIGPDDFFDITLNAKAHLSN